jgi:ribonuclease HI
LIAAQLYAVHLALVHLGLPDAHGSAEIWSSSKHVIGYLNNWRGKQRRFPKDYPSDGCTDLQPVLYKLSDHVAQHSGSLSAVYVPGHRNLRLIYAARQAAAVASRARQGTMDQATAYHQAAKIARWALNPA